MNRQHIKHLLLLIISIGVLAMIGCENENKSPSGLTWFQLDSVLKAQQKHQSDSINSVRNSILDSILRIDSLRRIDSLHSVDSVMHLLRLKRDSIVGDFYCHHYYTTTGNGSSFNTTDLGYSTMSVTRGANDSSAIVFAGYQFIYIVPGVTKPHLLNSLSYNGGSNYPKLFLSQDYETIEFDESFITGHHYTGVRIH